MKRGVVERGHNLESIKAVTEAWKPDFDAYMGKKHLSQSQQNKNVLNLHILVMMQMQ